ncbi:MAG TPA: hypothetical protein VGK64_23120, partial [Bryobacteraceae bacterium]
YVGRYHTGLLLFAILALTGAFFLLAFPRYIDTILSPEEKRQASQDAGAFGLLPLRQAHKTGTGEHAAPLAETDACPRFAKRD